MKIISTTICTLLCLFIAAGCDKQDEPIQAPSPQTQERGMLDQAAQTAGDTVNTVKDAAVEAFKDFTAGVDLDKSVSQLRAETEQMDVQSLRQVAMQYKDAIIEKQDELSVVSSRLADIPMTQRLGDEAKQLTGEAQRLTESIKALKDRYDVYIAAIRQHGGDLSGLLLQ